MLGAVIVLGTLGAINSSIFDFRTDELEQTFSVTTGSGETTANVTLSNSLWQDDVAHAEATSNNTSDAPSAQSYNTTSRQLLVGGLVADTTHTLTVTYNSQGLGEYTGAEEGVRHLPMVIILGLILVPLLTALGVFIKRS